MSKSSKGCANINTNKSKTELNKIDYTHIPISKDGNCFFRTISVYLTDTQENYKLIREIIAEYAEANRNQFLDFFIKDNIDQVLGSIELNSYIDNIKNDGEYAGIIEMSIASKIFNMDT